jgi:hypothetical protein
VAEGLLILHLLAMRRVCWAGGGGGGGGVDKQAILRRSLFCGALL